MIGDDPVRTAVRFVMLERAHALEHEKALTWEEIRARSLRDWEGWNLWCADCWMNWQLVELPCRRHCVGSEAALRDHRFGLAMSKIDWRSQ